MYLWEDLNELASIHQDFSHHYKDKYHIYVCLKKLLYIQIACKRWCSKCSNEEIQKPKWDIMMQWKVLKATA